jgi:hypothetical protein
LAEEGGSSHPNAAWRGRDTGEAFCVRGDEALYKDFDADRAALLAPAALPLNL